MISDELTKIFTSFSHSQLLTGLVIFCTITGSTVIGIWKHVKNYNKTKSKLKEICNLLDVNVLLLKTINKLDGLYDIAEDDEAKSKIPLRKISNIKNDLTQINSRIKQINELLDNNVIGEIENELDSAVYHHDTNKLDLAKKMYALHLNKTLINTEQLSKDEISQLAFCSNAYVYCCIFLDKKNEAVIHTKKIESIDGMALKHTSEQLDKEFYFQRHSFFYQHQKKIASFILVSISALAIYASFIAFNPYALLTAN